MSSKKTTIDIQEFKDELSKKVIALLDEERGRQANLSKIYGKPSYFFGQLKHGKPVNALHLKAIGEVFGIVKLAQLLSLDYTDYGEGPVDLEILSKVIKGVEEYLKAAKKEVEPETKARLVALLYDRFASTDEPVNEKTIASYLKLVA